MLLVDEFTSEVMVAATHFKLRVFFYKILIGNTKIDFLYVKFLKFIEKIHGQTAWEWWVFDGSGRPYQIDLISMNDELKWRYKL